MQDQLTFTFKPTSSYKTFAITLIVIALIMYFLAPRVDTLIAIAFMGIFGVFAYMQGRKLRQNTKLVLDEAGLNYLNQRMGFSVHWDQVKALRKSMKDGEVNRLSLVTSEGKLFWLAGFENMPRITAYIEKHIKKGDQLNILEKIRLYPLTLYIIGGVDLVGLAVRSYVAPSNPIRDLVDLACLISLFALHWLLPDNIRLTDKKSGWSGSLARKVLLNLLLWILVAGILMFVFESKN